MSNSMIHVQNFINWNTKINEMKFDQSSTRLNGPQDDVKEVK